MPQPQFVFDRFGRVLRQELTGLGDTALTMGKNMVMEPAAGYAGLLDLMRGRGLDSAVNTINSTQALAGGPQTAEGARNLQGIGNALGMLADPLTEYVVDPLGEVSPAAAAGLLGVAAVANPTKGAGKAAKAAKTGGAAAQLGFNPVKMRTVYPDTAPAVLQVDKKTGKEFLAKNNSAEALAVEKVRKAAQREIDAGQYQPLFDVEQRYYADPNKYPLSGATITDARPKKQVTIDKYTALYDTPQARENLAAAYDRGASDPLAHDWYATGQLADAYEKYLGPELGRDAYRTDFADGMAATTGGADPTANLLMAGYGNHLRAAGTPVPTNAHSMPYPIGGRYASGNMSMYDKVINQGVGLSAAEQPKRHNFSGNFLGHREFPTIDEQMSGLYSPGLTVPPGDSYSIFENVLNDVAKSKGVLPANFQDVAWKGAKGVDGKPMMQHINEAIYRTSKVTGLPQEEVLKNWIVNKAPLYGMGTVGLLGASMQGGDEE
jgi:hypothetical protein